jgi:hypothetical protein
MRAGYYKLGTFVASALGQGLTLIFAEGSGFNSGLNQQTTSILTLRLGNGTRAPNLSGLSIVSLEPGSGISALKAVATGSSKAPDNLSWDIYLYEAAFATSTYSVDLPKGAKWLPASTAAFDPGPASMMLVVGNVYKMPLLSGPVLAGPCTLNGYIAMVVGSATVHVATCK